VSLAVFKSRLLDARRVRLLALARADLVAAMSPALVTASEIEVAGATYHFVIDTTASDPWA
jgi:hypothetical protein